MQPDPLTRQHGPDAAAISALALDEPLTAEVGHRIADGVAADLVLVGQIFLRGQQTPRRQLTADDLLPNRVRDLPIERQAGTPGDHAGGPYEGQSAAPLVALRLTEICCVPARGWAGRSAPAPPPYRGATTVNDAASRAVRRAPPTHETDRRGVDMAQESEEPSTIAALDLRYITAVITEDEGDTILLVDDGETRIEFSPGAGGSWEQAVVGAQRIASTALEYAARIRGQETAHSAVSECRASCAVDRGGLPGVGRDAGPHRTGRRASAGRPHPHQTAPAPDPKDR